MMKTLTAWLILCCGLTGIAYAQGQNPKSFTFTANSQCLIINTDPSSTSGVYIDVSGTFSLTLQPAASVSGSTYKNVAVVPTTSQSQQATITAVGGYNAAVAGPDHFEVCTTGYVSGSAVVTLSPTTGVASNTLGGGGGGNGTVTNIATTSPVTGGPITGTGTIAISGVTAEQGNGAKLQLSTGTTTLNDCVKFDANGNTVDAGAACGSVGGANAALSNLSAVSINTSLLAQTGTDLGGTSNPFQNLYIFGAGTYGSTYFKFTGTPTSTRTWTIQDATDTLVGRATTDTLTNKSISAAQVNSGTLAIAQGGTNAGTAANARISLFPAASEVGDLVYCATYSSGCTSWALLAGNTSGTQYLQETSGGAPSWTTPTGSGTVNSGTATHLAIYATSTTAVSNDSTATDDGTTLTYTGTGGVKASAGPLVSGLPAGGVGSSFFLDQEGTIPTGLSTSGQDDCYADSTQHGILCNFNAGTTLPLVQGPASATSGHIATWSGTNGGKLVDGGAAGAGTVTSVAQSVPTGFAIGGSPVTTSGTLAITTSGLTTNHLQKAVSGGIADSTVLDNATTVSTTEPFVSSTYDTCPDTSASGTAQVCNTTPTFTVVTGSCVVYTTTTANTGTGLTLNVNSLGAKSVAKWQGSTTLAANDVLANKEVLACYDGTNWELGTIGNAPGGTGTVTSVATTAPITGGTFTTSGTIACATCDTSASSLTSNQPVNGAGGQAEQVGFTDTAGTITSGHLACYTASNTIGNCTGTPSNNIIGVFNSSTTWIASGETSVTLDATVNVTFGDILCASSTAGDAHDNGTSSCASGEWIGIVKTTASSVSSATAFVTLR